MKSLSRVRLLATPWTAAYQAPPSMGFSRQDYWSGVSLPSPEAGLGDMDWERTDTYTYIKYAHEYTHSCKMFHYQTLLCMMNSDILFSVAPELLQRAEEVLQ